LTTKLKDLKPNLIKKEKKKKKLTWMINVVVFLMYVFGKHDKHDMSHTQEAPFFVQSW